MSRLQKFLDDDPTLLREVTAEEFEAVGNTDRLADGDRDMTSSHSEKEIYKGCLALMETLKDEFYKWLDSIGVDVSELDDEEQFCCNYYPTEIVERLFLWATTHSGGTSQRMKCAELGIDNDKVVSFNFSDELEDAE